MTTNNPYIYAGRRRAYRLDVSDFIQLAFDHNLEWIGVEVANARTKTRWKCSQGHEFEAQHFAIKNGNGCPFCRDKKRKANPYHVLKPEQYETLAQERGFTFLGVERAGRGLKGRWRCPENHEWLAIYTKIKSGQGCPICQDIHQNDARRVLPEKYHELAKARRFTWLEDWPGSVQRKTHWRCQFGHEWAATYSHIEGGRGCPFCVDIINGHRVSQPQRELHAILGGELNCRVGRYAIDVALIVNGINIAVEYDCWYWHKGTKRKENKRDKFLLKQGWRILHIRTNFEFPTREQLDNGIQQLMDGALIAEVKLDWGGR